MRNRRTFSWAVITVAVIAVAAILSFGPGVNDTPKGPTAAPLILGKTDRLLILAPHPDDEVLGCGGIIQKAVAMDLPVHVAFFTYGDFYEWSFIVYKKRLVLTPKGVEGMARVRHGEAIAADSSLGLSAEDLSFLGYPDFGTLDMWYRAWGQAPPVRGTLTKAAAVPYEDALRPGAPYKADEALADLTAILRKVLPTKVFVSHPADHHPDHRALYLFTRIALLNIDGELSPDVYPYLVHYTDFPAPEGRRPDLPLNPPAGLTGHVDWRTSALGPQETQRKSEALKLHKTQYETTPHYLDSFVRSNELFGDFPVVSLRTDAGAHPLLEASADSTPEAQAVEQEQAHLVGIVSRTVKLEGNCLVFSMDLTRPLAEEVESSVYLFGYRTDTPFSQMPKLHVKLGPITHTVHDGEKQVAWEGLAVTRSARHVDIRVPLERMGQPEKILTSAQTYAAEIPLHWAAWRILDVGVSK